METISEYFNSIIFTHLGIFMKQEFIIYCSDWISI